MPLLYFKLSFNVQCIQRGFLNNAENGFIAQFYMNFIFKR